MINQIKWQSYNDTQNNSLEPKCHTIDWFESIAIALTLIVVMFAFCVRAVVVSGSSMKSTLNNNDRIIVQSFLYTPKQGDIVVIDSFNKFGKPLVKRIIAIEGDTININSDTNQVAVNGIILDEPYISSSTFLIDLTELSTTIPHGMVFVMGDNREHSLDSRSSEIGYIDERDILGKVFFRIYPFSNIGVING